MALAMLKIERQAFEVVTQDALSTGISQKVPERIRPKVARVHQLLLQEYSERVWRRHNDPVSELILTILSQNTSDVNSGRAFRKLKEAFESWEAVRDADEEGIAEAIKSAGLSNIKARRIKAVLRRITETRGELSLDFLNDLSVAEARAWLLSLEGVGPKTAACVLLFSLGKPAMPVDTHVYRVSRRLGLVDARASVEAVHELLEAALRPEEIYSFHVNLIAHGRRICKAQNPLCDKCVLYYVCDNPVTLPRYKDGQ